MTKPTIAEILAKPDPVTKMITGRREAVFNRASAKEEDRTVEIAFSSEDAKVQRWFGAEILSHAKGAVNMERFKSGRANVLVNHDPSDWVAVIDSARVDDDKVGRAVVRFGNSARANEVFRDVREGILTSISVGYSRDDMKLTKESDDGDEYTVTRWTPFEASLVTIPADTNVGVGRAAETLHQPAKSAELKERQMEAGTNAPAGGAADVGVMDQPNKVNPVEIEKMRRRGIENLCKANKLDDLTRDHWIASGTTMDRVAEEMLGIMEERGRENPQSASKLGLTKKEIKQFSLCRAIDACGTKDWLRAGFEAECSTEIAKRLGRLEADRNRFFVPLEIQQRADRTPVEDLAYQLMKRDLTVASGAGGGFLVETANVGFIELLRNRSVLMNMGARRLTGLVGNVSIPKQTVAATAVWLANEASTITESQQTFAQVALVPKTVGGYTEISRLLLLQSDPSAEGLVKSDLAAVVSLAVDLAGLNGSGAAGQPTGIISTAGIGGVTGTSIAYAGIIEFQTDTATGNALFDASGYVTTPAVAGLLKQRVKFTSTASPIWDGKLMDANVDGYRGMASNQVPTANILFGDFSQVIIAEWGTLEIEVNPFANFQSGIVGVRAIYSIDIGVRYPAAFSLATSVT
jgi:HK97 family phage major capsid protein/HK97 family phage prohead protease